MRRKWKQCMVHRMLKVNTACICKESHCSHTRDLWLTFFSPQLKKKEQRLPGLKHRGWRQFESRKNKREQSRRDCIKRNWGKWRGKWRLTEQTSRQSKRGSGHRGSRYLLNCFLLDVTQLLNLPSVKVTAWWPKGKGSLMGQLRAETLKSDCWMSIPSITSY